MTNLLITSFVGLALVVASVVLSFSILTVWNVPVPHVPNPLWSIQSVLLALGVLLLILRSIRDYRLDLRAKAISKLRQNEQEFFASIEMDLNETLKEPSRGLKR